MTIRYCEIHPGQQVHPPLLHCNLCAQIEIEKRAKVRAREERIEEQVEVFRRCVDYILEVVDKATS